MWHPEIYCRGGNLGKRNLSSAIIDPYVGGTCPGYSRLGPGRMIFSLEHKVGAGGFVMSWMTLPLGIRWDVTLGVVVRGFTA